MSATVLDLALPGGVQVRMVFTGRFGPGDGGMSRPPFDRANLASHVGDQPDAVAANRSALAGLDYLGFGLPASAPSLGQLARQAQQNLQMPSLAFVAFFTYAIMLTLIVFIFEGVRDAFDPRKTFR